MIRQTDRTPDPVHWRLIRRAILFALRAALRRVLRAREIAMPDGPFRLLQPEIDAIARTVEAQAIQLRPFADLDRLPNLGNRLMVELAVYTSAGYRSLLDAGIPPEQARRIVADAGWLVYARMLALASLPFRLTSRDPGTRLRRTIRSLLRFPFSAPGAPGYAVKTRIKDGDILTDFTHCPPQSFVRALIARDDRGDMEAFRQSWCRYDWPGADLIAGDRQRRHYSRPHTLSQGDAVCDMCWQARAGSCTLPDGTALDLNLKPQPRKERQ